MWDLNNNERIGTCPCCHSESIKPTQSIKYYKNTRYSNVSIRLMQIPELWLCEDCNSGFVQNKIKESDSIKLYKSGNGWNSKEFSHSKSPQVIKYVQDMIRPDLEVLDIGCSDGALLDFVRSKGASTSGCEYSKTNIQILKKKGHIAYNDLNSIDRKVDIIFAFDLVEHLYHLPEFLSRCYSILNEGGKLVILTGDIESVSAKKASGRWWYVKAPEHIIFPSSYYFSQLDSWKLIESISVFPRPFFVSGRAKLLELKKLIGALIRNIVDRDLHPLPWGKKDHVLLVLEKHKKGIQDLI